MKKLLVLVTALLATNFLYAQFSISGKVSGDDLDVLVGANVVLEGISAEATDGDGLFSFSMVKAGTYQLTISFIGYREYSTLFTVNSDLSLDIELITENKWTEEVIVSATRANNNTPVAYTDLDNSEINSRNLGQDLPYLLNYTPSLVTTSDAGTGIGYSGMRIRGSDATRVNITINGIPYNDAESQGTFWVNMPDFSSSLNSIQIQRGVGTSTNGAGAFGASINLETSAPIKEAFAEINNTIGSFGTRKHNLIVNTGLLDDKWSIEGRLSQIASDGFIDRSAANLKSYFLSGSYLGKKTTLKALVFGGKEITQQAWYGTPEAVLKNDIEGIEAVINNNGVTEQQAINLRNDGRKFNWYTYENEVDNYSQDHYQLHLNQEINNVWSFSLAGHYTYGRGYFEQFRKNEDFEKYGQNPIIIARDSIYDQNDFNYLVNPDIEKIFRPILTNGDTIKNGDGEVYLDATAQISESDFVRRRWLDNDFYGFTYSINYQKAKITAVLGGGYHYYSGDHFGEIIWAEYATNINIGERYYDNTGVKKDFNSFLKVNYQLNKELNLFGDFQVRAVNYFTTGSDSDLRLIEVGDNLVFVNPKLGLTYQINESTQLYSSYSIGNREPDRNDFVDNANIPKHETLKDFEMGLKQRKKNYTLEINLYNMFYNNQLVLTGALNDVGSGIRVNAPLSYRRGVELNGAVKFNDQLSWNANIAFSKNKIKGFTEVLYDYGAGFDEYNVVENKYEDSDIAFSPNVIVGSNMSYSPINSMTISILTKYVGKQFLDNTSNEARKIESYFVNDLQVSFSFRTNFIREIGLNILVNNLLDYKYESNGYTFGYSGGPDFVVRENYLYPQAGTNFLAGLSLKF